MASAGELCDQCFAGSLHLHEGMLVCDVCGSIHQVSPRLSGCRQLTVVLLPLPLPPTPLRVWAAG